LRFFCRKSPSWSSVSVGGGVGAGHLGGAALIVAGFGVGGPGVAAGLGMGGLGPATTLHFVPLTSTPGYTGPLPNAAQVVPTGGPPTQTGAANAASANKGGVLEGVPRRPSLFDPGTGALAQNDEPWFLCQFSFYQCSEAGSERPDR
jgi:hypothetical protein